jgi:hypothetical protein
MPSHACEAMGEAGMSPSLRKLLLIRQVTAFLTRSEQGEGRRVRQTVPS